MDIDELIRDAKCRVGGARRLLSESKDDASRAEAMEAVREAQSELDALMSDSGWAA